METQPGFLFGLRLSGAQTTNTVTGIQRLSWLWTWKSSCREYGRKGLDFHCLKHWRHEAVLSRGQEDRRIQLECSNKIMWHTLAERRNCAISCGCDEVFIADKIVDLGIKACICVSWTDKVRNSRGNNSLVVKNTDSGIDCLV